MDFTPDYPTPPDPKATAEAQQASNRETASYNQLINSGDVFHPDYSVRQTVNPQGEWQAGSFNDGDSWRWTGEGQATEADHKAVQAIHDRYEPLIEAAKTDEQKRALRQDRYNEKQGAGFEKGYWAPTTDTHIELTGVAKEIDEASKAANLDLVKLGGELTTKASDHLSTPFTLDGVPGRGTLKGYNSEFSGGDLLSMLTTPRGSTEGYQTSFDGSAAGERGTLSFSGAPELNTIDAGAFGDYGLLSLSGAPELAESYNGDFDRTRYEDALRERSQAEFDERWRTREARLAAQGITPGSEAYERERRTHYDLGNRRELDIIADGGREMALMEGLARDRAGFGNQARAQFVAEQSAVDADADEARSAAFQEALTAAGFNNAARAQFTGEQSAINADRDADQAAVFNQLAAEFGLSNEAVANLFGLTEAQRSSELAELVGEYGRDVNAQQLENSAVITEKNARDATRATAIQEAAFERNQPLNEIAALLGFDQIQAPNMNPAQVQATPFVDVAGLTQQSFANQMGIAQQQNAFNQALMGGLFDLGGSAITGGATLWGPA